MCLIPASAHGTNAASAAMAGMRVVVVACDDHGNVDLDDLKAKAVEHAERPRRADGHVPVDPRRVRGAHPRDLRARARARRPGVPRRRQPQRARRRRPARQVRRRRVAPEPAQDVLHPARRRRSGRRPDRRRARTSRRSCPTTRCAPRPGPATGVGAISAAPWGSAGILPISWAYIAMMGGAGLTRATARRDPQRELPRAPPRPALPGALHRRERAGRARVHHRPAADHARHRRHRRRRRQAPDRLRLPRADDVVPGRGHADDRADRVGGPRRARPLRRRDDRDPGRDRPRSASGEWPADDNPLVHAPHTAEDVIADEWAHAYPRELAAFPVSGLRHTKYWPPVGRIDGVYGDRNVFCSCPPVEAYA